MLKLDDIHKAKDFLETEVEVPEWGGKVKIRTLSMAARYEISERAIVKGESAGVDTVKFAAGTLSMGLIDPKMSYDEALKVVREHSPEPIQRIADEVWRLSGLSGEVAKNASSPA